MALINLPTLSASSLAVCFLAKMQFGWTTLRFLGIHVASLVVLTAGYLIWGSIIYPKFVSPLRRFPQFTGGHWLMGHSATTVKYGMGEVARRAGLVPNDGFVHVLEQFNQESIVVLSPQALSELLVTKAYNFERHKGSRNFLASIFGWGLLTSEGAEHKRQRKMLNPAFSFRHVKELYPTFWAKAREVTTAMTAACERQNVPDGAAELNVGSWASRCTLDIIGLAGFGLDFNAIEKPDDFPASTYQTLGDGKGVAELMMLRLVVPEWIASRVRTKRAVELAEASGAIRTMCEGVLEEKKAEVTGEKPTGKDIISVAMANGDAADATLVDQMMTFLLAGHETTSTALTWAVWLLCCHPEVQSKLQAEVRAHLPSVDAADPSITSADIDDLPYLTAVVNETLRVCNPVGFTRRIAQTGVTLAGEFFPKGTMFVVSPWATNTDAKLWGEDPGAFRPERWMAPQERAATGGADNSYAFMSFLHGTRRCIGDRFARGEFACLLAAWVGRFTFELKDKALLDRNNVPIEPSVVVKPAGGLEVLVTVNKEY